MPELTLKATMDSTGVKKGLDQAKTQVGQFSKSFSGVSNALSATGVNLGVFGRMGSVFSGLTGALGKVGGAIGFVVVGIGAFIASVATACVKTVQWAHTLKAQAAQSGVTAEELQKIRNAGIGTSASAEDMTGALNRIEAAQAELIDGTKKTVEAFAALNLSEERVAASNPAEVLRMVAKAYVDSGQSAGAYAAMLDLLGKRTLPVIREAIIALGGDIDKLNASIGTMSESQVAFLDSLADKWDKFRARVGNTARGLAAEILMGFLITEGLGGWIERGINEKLANANKTAELQKEANIAAFTKRKTQDGVKADAKAELKALEESDKRAKALDVSVSFSPIGDALSKIGGKVGGVADNGALGLAMRQLAVQEKTLEVEREILKEQQRDKLRTEAAGGTIGE